MSNSLKISRVLAILSIFLCMVCMVIFIHLLMEKCFKCNQENTSANNSALSMDENANFSISHITTEHIVGPFSVILVVFMIFMHFGFDQYFVPLRFHLFLEDAVPLLRGSAIITSYIYYRNPHLRRFVKHAIVSKNQINPRIEVEFVSITE